MICEIVCDCFFPSPFPPEQEACVVECIDENDVGTLPQDCAECIFAHKDSCSTLEADCDAECDDDTDPPQPLPDASVSFPDAF